MRNEVPPDNHNLPPAKYSRVGAAIRIRERIEDIYDSVGDRIDSAIGLNRLWNNVVGLGSPDFKRRWALLTREEKRREERIQKRMGNR